MAVKPPAFPWARNLDAEKLAAFIEDLWGAASGGDDLKALDAIEKVIAEHRPTRACPLNAKQLKVLNLLAAGETYESAAKRLGFSATSVKNFCSEIYTRLGVRNAPHAVALGVQYGWLSDIRIPEAVITPVTHPPRTWREIYRKSAAQMREQPGVPVEIGPYVSISGARNAAKRMRKGLWEEFRPAGAFDAKSQRTDAGYFVIVACYVGEPVNDAERAAQ
ncbi:LuxR C-terminal-related transcriptional regulator [Streptomyces sp. NPDC014802]|uniref:LuxR C-terminal-related transcriptional regulator n=1 Tax=Streptomyces sp. NPDC014802 TaxID=3364917 RepID=UPI0036FEAB2A